MAQHLSTDATALRPLKGNPRVYGIVLLITTAASVMLWSHVMMNPGLIPLAVTKAGLAVALIFLATAASGFAWQIGIDHPLVMAGWLSYLLGCLLLGLNMPGIGDAVPGHMVPECGRFGLIWVSVGVVFWGHALLHYAGLTRWLGLLGMATGGGAAVLALTTQPGFTPGALFGFVALHTVWNLGVAAKLIRG